MPGYAKARPGRDAAPGGSCAGPPVGFAVPGATGRLILRMDAGFWSLKVIPACVDHKAEFAITLARQPVLTTAIDAIAAEDWVDIAYPTAEPPSSPKPHGTADRSPHPHR
jgi:hypothetical protein